MRRLARHALNALTVLSLLLCVATVALWVRGRCGTSDGVEVVTPWHGYWQLYANDALIVTHVARWPEARRLSHVSLSASTGVKPRWAVIWTFGGGIGGAHAEGGTLAGIGLYRGEASVVLDDGGTVLRGPPFPPGSALDFRWSRPMPFWKVDLAGWTLPVALGLLPAVRVGGRAMRRRRMTVRMRAGLCPRCAYDLTGNVSGVCPECGTKVG